MESEYDDLGGLYAARGWAGLTELAASAGTSGVYLYQLAVKFRNKRPSAKLAERLCAAEPRLDFRKLLLGKGAENG